MKITRGQLRGMILSEAGLIAESAAPPSPELLAITTSMPAADIQRILDAIDEQGYDIVHRADAEGRVKRYTERVKGLEKIIISLGGTPPLQARTY